MSEIEDKRWSARFILPEQRAGLQRLAEEKCKVERPIPDAQQIEDMEITVAQSMEFGAPLVFEVYDAGYIREVVGPVQYVDHIRKEFRVKDDKGDTILVKFLDIINVKSTLSV
ncbi:YolD-like family protein [Bacillus atrophaeus]|uniref:YolD-like family protein n=1 Tax=Bacillus atrophaeus TaxID=1452 RepID=UPI00227E7F84|nr:YolD-like family protein [Bacillus atrophaeus]MCY9198916.1 YolD-like family protein [Bacillus atrophaeus]